MITLRCFGLLRLETGLKEARMEASDVPQLLKALQDQFPRQRELIRGSLVLVNGKSANRRAKLSPEDRVDLFPPVAGG